MPFCGPSHPTDTQITTQLRRKEFLPRCFCIGEQLFTFWSLSCRSVIYTCRKMSLSGYLQERVWVVVFSPSMEETRIKIFLFEVSDQNLNLRSQHFSRGWVANLRSSPSTSTSRSSLSSLETSVHIPHQPHSHAHPLCFPVPPPGNPGPHLTHHPPTNVVTEKVTLC